MKNNYFPFCLENPQISVKEGTSEIERKNMVIFVLEWKCDSVLLIATGAWVIQCSCDKEQFSRMEVSILGGGKVDGSTTSGNLMFQTKIRYGFIAKFLNEDLTSDDLKKTLWKTASAKSEVICHCGLSSCKENCSSSSLEVSVWHGLTPKAWEFVFQEWWCSYFFILVAYEIKHLCSAHSNIFIPWNRYSPVLQYLFLEASLAFVTFSIDWLELVFKPRSFCLLRGIQNLAFLLFASELCP